MELPDDNLSDDDQSPLSDELDASRIRHVSQARRAAMRMASYFTIAALACAISAIDLGMRAIRQYHDQDARLFPIVYLLAAAFLIFTAAKLTINANSLRRESRQCSLPNPTAPPDFSTLSDGAHIITNLENIE